MTDTICERIDAVTLIGPERLNAVVPAPKSVKIEVSPRCQFRCGFCALRTRSAQPTCDMDIGLFQRVTLEMQKAGVQEIGVFYLGESFMNPSLLIECIKWCKRYLGIPYVFLTSNASLAKPWIVGELMRAGLDSLKWSVNAADGEQFEKIMGVKSQLFWQALANIKTAWLAREAGKFETRLYASSIVYDDQQKEKMQKLLEEFVLPFVDQHYWLPLYSMGSLAEKREAELGYRPTAGNQGRLDKLRDPLPCWSAFTEGHVRSDGHLSVCCFGADERFDAGDLTKQSFMEAWNSEKFQEIRMAHLKKDVTGTMCEDCIAYK
jgi:MoaA/NifB/PqqE/SkfB family radical SAM enzyme